MSLAYMNRELRRIDTPVGEYFGPCADPQEAARRLAARQKFQEVVSTGFASVVEVLYPEAVVPPAVTTPEL